MTDVTEPVLPSPAEAVNENPSGSDVYLEAAAVLRAMRPPLVEPAKTNRILAAELKMLDGSIAAYEAVALEEEAGPQGSDSVALSSEPSTFVGVFFAVAFVAGVVGSIVTADKMVFLWCMLPAALLLLGGQLRSYWKRKKKTNND